MRKYSKSNYLIGAILCFIFSVVSFVLLLNPGLVLGSEQLLPFAIICIPFGFINLYLYKKMKNEEINKEKRIEDLEKEVEKLKNNQNF